jgi:hypothetical protein
VGWKPGQENSSAQDPSSMPGSSQPGAGASPGSSASPGQQTAPIPTSLRHPSSPISGQQLSTLLTAPDGFTFKAETSSDSGSAPAAPVPNHTDPTTITCSDWWSGRGHFGPGTVASSVRNFTRPDQMGVGVTASVFPDGASAGMVDSSVAIMSRCTHFTYTDTNTSQYLVDDHPGPTLTEGDRAWTYDATETSGTGTVFPTQVTYVLVGDVFLVITEIGPAGSNPDRTALPIHQWVTALEAAGY